MCVSRCVIICCKKNSTTTPSQESQAITQQLINHLKSMGINVHNREKMVQYLNEHGYNSIQEAVGDIYEIDIDYLNSQYKIEGDTTIEEILDIVKAKKYNKSGTDAVTIDSENHQIIYTIDHSANNELEDNLKEGDGFGIRHTYKLEDLNGENGEEFVRSLIRDIAADYGYSETRIRKVLQNLGVRPKNMLGSNLAAELKRMSYDNALVSRLGRGRGTKVGYYKNSKGSRKNKGDLRQKEEFYITPQGEIYGFVAPNGDMYLDETVVSPEHPIHEYTHLWDVFSLFNPL